MVQGKINRDRHTDHPDGRHSIRTKQCPPPPSPIFYRPDALFAAQPTVSKHWRQHSVSFILLWKHNIILDAICSRLSVAPRCCWKSLNLFVWKAVFSSWVPVCNFCQIWSSGRQLSLLSELFDCLLLVNRSVGVVQRVVQWNTAVYTSAEWPSVCCTNYWRRQVHVTTGKIHRRFVLLSLCCCFDIPAINCILTL